MLGWNEDQKQQSDAASAFVLEQCDSASDKKRDEEHGDEAQPLGYSDLLEPGNPIVEQAIRSGSELPQAPDYRAETARATEILKVWAKLPEAPRKIVYLLEHQYSPAGLSFSGLKNGDAAFGSVLTEAAAGAGYAVHLGIVHIEESGAADVFYEPYRGSRSRWSRWDTYNDEDDENGDSDEGEQADDDEFEIIEAFETSESIDNWVNTEDRLVDFGKLPLSKGNMRTTSGV